MPPGHGTYCLRIHGQTYHCSNTLHPNEGEDRQYGQLYGAPPVNRDIIIYPRDRPPQRISYMSCNLDPMSYPLLFPRGDPGWHNAIEHVAEQQTSIRNKVTMQQYYNYRIAIRETFSPIHSAGKLFQQYAVDAYVKTEGCRLYFIKT